MAALWLTVSFVTRALGAHDQQNIGYATTSQLLLLLAPLCKGSRSLVREGDNVPAN